MFHRKKPQDMDPKLFSVIPKKCRGTPESGICSIELDVYMSYSHIKTDTRHSLT